MTFELHLDMEAGIRRAKSKGRLGKVFTAGVKYTYSLCGGITGTAHASLVSSQCGTLGDSS